jgi:glycosyltransferase involved in cell wall biosynthesis
MHRPLVSIIIPTFNRAAIITDTLDSVKNQKYNNWECFIIDDGSNDNTEEVVQNYSNHDIRFHYIKKQNGGSASARNEGLKYASGQYVLFLDSDDLLHPDMISKHIRVLQEKPETKMTISNFVCFSVSEKKRNLIKNIDWSNKITENFTHDILFRWDNKFSIHLFNVLIDKRALEDIKFDETLRAKEDWLFFTNLSYKIGNNIQYIDKELGYYRIHNQNKEQKNPIFFSEYYKVLFLIYETTKGRPEENLFYERLKKEILAIHQKQAAICQEKWKPQSLISVIMPAFNSEKFISESIDSVLAQTYPLWELIVIDDGSTDSTAEIVKHYAQKDNRIKYYYQTNQRQGRARNNGISKSQGEWIAFLDHDDLWIPEKLEKQLDCAIRQQVDLVFSNVYISRSPYNSLDDTHITSTGIFHGNDALKTFLAGNRIPILSTLVRKSAVQNCGGFEEHPSIQNADDYLLWLNMLANNYSFFGMPDRLAIYRLHTAQASGTDPYCHEQVIHIFNSFFKAPAALDGYFKIIKLWWYKDWYCRVAKDYKSALRILNSLKTNESLKLVANTTKIILLISGLKISKLAIRVLIFLKVRLI